jgi:hypothetical protein
MWECPTEIRDIDEVIEVGEEMREQLTPCLDEMCVGLLWMSKADSTRELGTLSSGS